MTQSEINETARSLGMTPEACPWLWKNTRIRHCINHFSTEQNVRLPDPESDDPAVMLWDGALMQALDKARLDPQVSLGGNETCVIIGTPPNEWYLFKPQTTAALLAAWRATQ